MSDVAHLLLQCVSHIALALTTPGKFLAKDHNNLVILAVILPMMDAVQTGDRSGLTGRVLFAGLADRYAHLTE